MFTTYIYFIVAWGGAFIQLSCLNLAMVNYDQAEIGPLNESLLILLNLICGGIILDEQRLYKWWQLILLLGCSLICIIGIIIFITKPKIKLLEVFAEKRRKLTVLEDTQNSSYLQISCEINEDGKIVQQYEN